MMEMIMAEYEQPLMYFIDSLSIANRNKIQSLLIRTGHENYENLISQVVQVFDLVLQEAEVGRVVLSRDSKKIERVLTLEKLSSFRHVALLRKCIESEKE